MTPSQLTTLISNNDRVTLIKALRAMKLWTYEDLKFLRDNAATMKYKDIAIALYRTEIAVRKKACKVNMVKIKAAISRPVKIVRPPAVYSNVNLRDQILNKYAPL